MSNDIKNAHRFPTHLRSCLFHPTNSQNPFRFSDSLDNQSHDVIHPQWLATQCFLVQNTVKTPKTLPSNFYQIACHFPGHGRCAICSQADSTGPVHPEHVEHSNERSENVMHCCGVCHQQSKPHHWATSVTSMLLSTATKNAQMTLCLICLSKSPARSYNLSATEFLVWRMLAKACRCQDTTSATFSNLSSQTDPQCMALMLMLLC